MDAIKCLLTRRSVRKYLPDEVKKEDIETILKCASYAPSAKNNQAWHFSVVTNKDWLNKMSKLIGKHFNNPNYNVTYGAPVLIIVSDKKGLMIYEHDGSCALENIFLAAHALNLGTCWINQLGEDSLYDNQEFLNLLKEAGVPEDYKVIGCACLGHYENNPEPKERKKEITTFLK